MARDWVQTNKPWRANNGDRWNSNGRIFICTSGGTNAGFVDYGSSVVASNQASILVRANTSSGYISSLQFDEGNGITFGGGGGAAGLMNITASHNGLTNQSQFVQSNAAFAGTNASGTIASNGISVSVAAPGAGGGVAIAADGSSLSNGTVYFSNSNGVSFGMSVSTITASHNGLTTAMASNRGSDFVQATAAFAGTSASGTIASNGISVSIGPYITTARASNDAIGLNTAQSNVTWTANSAGLSLDARGYAGTGTSLTNATATLNSLGLQLSIAAPGGGAGATISDWNPPWAYSGQQLNASLGQNTLYFVPFDLFCHVSASRINFVASINITQSSANSTGSARIGMAYALYTHGTGDSTTHISRLTSYTLTLIHASMSSTTNFSATHYIGLSDATSHSTSQRLTNVAAAGTYPASSLNGHRVVGLPVNSTLAPGRYWLGLIVSTAAANAMGVSLNIHQTSVGGVAEVRPFGTSSAATNASVFRMLQGWGSYSATSGAFPDTIALTTDNIRAAVSQTLIHFDINAQPYTTYFI